MPKLIQPDRLQPYAVVTTCPKLRGHRVRIVWIKAIWPGGCLVPLLACPKPWEHSNRY